MSDLALGSRLRNARPSRGGGWQGECPRCGNDTFWVFKGGFSCSDVGCGWKSADFAKLKIALDHMEGIESHGPAREPHIGETFDRVLGPLLDEVDRRKKLPIEAVPTHLPAWNKCCRDEGGGVGLARGWHLIVAGNTGMGKSLLALNLAAQAVRHGERVGLISLEMSQIQTVTRYMSIFTSIPVHRLEHGSHYDSDAAWEAKSRIEEHHERTNGVLLTNRRQISKLSDIVGAMRWLREHENCRYFVTDYLQLAWTGNAEKQNDRITEVSHAVRGAANDLGVVSIGVSQFNRTTSTSKERPAVQGLMGGSSLENDSEQILLLDHTTYVERAMDTALIKLVLGKNRHGPTGEIPMCWDKSTLRCYEVESSRFDP